MQEPEIAARFEERGLDVVPVLPRPEQLHAGDARHAVMQGTHLPPGNGELAHVEELDLGQRATGRALEHLQRVRALNLVPVEPAATGRVDRRPLVALHTDVVPTGLGVVLHPVVRGRTAHEDDAVLGHAEEDPVADHVPVVVAGDELLRLVDGEALEAVDAELREQRDDIGALDVQVGHVVRLVEQRAGLPPGALLVAPVGELTRHLRIDIRPDLRVARQLDGAADRAQHVLQTAMTHRRLLLVPDKSLRRPREPSLQAPEAAGRTLAEWESGCLR